jgi:hypothetical protein
LKLTAAAAVRGPARLHAAAAAAAQQPLELPVGALQVANGERSGEGDTVRETQRETQ